MLQSVMTYTIIDPVQTGKSFEYYDLRWRILRQPWGQPKGTERDDQEDESVHRLLVDDSGHVLACGRLHMNSADEAQVRYMAVEGTFRSKGYGRLILSELEEVASLAGASKIVLQAREPALGFYQACGYTVIAKTFLLYGEIQHYLMERNL
ncbi:MAG: GNAT family N-acetyltransferase [Sphingobacteriales bacterium]|jgi:predicted GNAT family N-acyltransferase|nr:GNAT family N-acetyltransferase [Sphingobacteriales bacterium]